MADNNISKITLDGTTYQIKDITARQGLNNIPTKVSQLQNDSGYLTEHQSLDGYAEKATTLAGYGITDAYTKTESDGKYDVKGAAAERVKSVSKKDNSIDLTGTKEVSIGVKLSTNANNQLSLQSDGLYVPPAAEQTDYTVTVSESTPGGYAKAYTLTQNGTSIGTINIPKDLVVESGTVETNPTGQPEGTYLVLTLANTSSDKIYINVGSLIEYVTSGSATSDSVQVVIDGTTHKVTAYIKDGTVTKAKLDSSVQSSLNKADNSLSTTGDATNVTNTITTASTRANLVSGETLGISLGKIRKWFNDLKAVAFSGSYNDLSDKPTIPTVPTNVSAFTNDAGYLTEHQDISGKANVSGQVFTGTVEAPVVKTTSYFYTPALVNEGDLTKYYHRLNLGYAKHDYWEFHEYGGDYRFYKNTAGTDAGKSLIANITSTGSNFVGQLKEGGVRVYSPNNKPTAADLGITIPEAYVLPVANQNTLGGIKVGAGLSITAEGVLSATGAPVTSVDGSTGAITTNAVKYTEQSLTNTQKTQARTNIGAGTGNGNCSSIVKSNVSVATSAWNSSTTYSDYPFRASVSISGVTTSYVPEVIFNMTDATGGNFAPVCETYNGGVYIYAKEKPTTTITIPTIECRTTV